MTGILQTSFTSWLLTILLRSLSCDTRSHPTDAARTEQSKSDHFGVQQPRLHYYFNSFLVYHPHNGSSYSLGDSLDASDTSIRAGEPEGIAV